MRAKSKMLHRFAFVPAIRYNKGHSIRMCGELTLPIPYDH